MSLPSPHGLYDPAFEHDACGVGFVASLKRERSHQIIVDADRVLRSMAHRGASGAEANSGDGAGILTGLPHELLARVALDELGVTLPPPGRYAAGNVFLPQDREERAHCKRTFERIIAEQGQTFLGWRVVPTDPKGADLGPTARQSMPAIEQLFVGSGIPKETLEGDAEFERQLYIIRKAAGTALRSDARLRQSEKVYVCTLSPRVIVYKGMLTAEQLRTFYPDLSDWSFKSHLAMVHSRFSTNTFPTWDRAQPLRCMSHNGEINTLRGNVNSMHDRERVLHSERFGDELPKCFPIAEPFQSDSGNFDNVLEMLWMGGRSLPAAMMMMIPEAWQKDPSMSAEKRAFYEYHSCLMEPWDGPASIAFTDGRFIGAVLDRNGLRPSRWLLTHDGTVVMASEAGALPIDHERVKEKGRLRPGRMFLVDFEEGRMLPDAEVKERIAGKEPYAKWLEEGRLTLKQIVDTVPAASARFEPETLLQRSAMFGYTTETLEMMLLPMVVQKRDPLGSMGNDAALACLSEKPRLLYDYFKQLFAQVTNPPIDSIREEVIMSLRCYCGPEGNLLDVGPEHCRRLRLPHPILSNEEMHALVQVSRVESSSLEPRTFETQVIDCTWPRSRGAAGLDVSLRRIAAEAEAAVDEGYSLIVLSDRNAGRDAVPISSLLAVGAVHQHLTRVSKRTRVGLIAESGEAREVHHHCCLVGFGADAVNPYLAFESLWQAAGEGQLSMSRDEVVEAYKKAVGKGMLKVLAKMGISTLQSYKGAQIFEAVGLSQTLIDQCFTGTVSRIKGIGFSTLADDAVRRHERAYSTKSRSRAASPRILPNDGQFHWRSGGEKRMWNPNAITTLQRAARFNDESAYWDFAANVDESEEARCTLRGLLRFRSTTPIPLDEVEPASLIVRRFATGAMSFGSISKETHETLARAMNALGAKSNTGEGGEDPARYLPILVDGKPGKTNPRRSAIKQVASGRFGVTIEYLTHADELQIKMAQGAKPGEGGELPGRKVDAVIARVRHSTPGIGLISPPPHHDIYSIEDLAELVFDLKCANPDARISVKLVSEAGVGTIAAGVAKAHAEHILISGHDGGTGASPLTSVKHTGLPWELGIAEAHQTLVQSDLRSRVVIQADGQLKTGRDVVIAALLGAEEFGFSTAPLVTLGCLMMRKCHLNTCPVGIATQDPVLRERFDGEPESVINYLMMVAEHARRIMAGLGFRSVDEMIGRVEVLEMDPRRVNARTVDLDLSAMLTPARALRPGTEVRHMRGQDHGLDQVLDNRLVELASPWFHQEADRIGPARLESHLLICTRDRAVGTLLSHRLSKARVELAPDTLTFRFRGAAGQSFGAWLARGVRLDLEGEANDSVGKGLSGGKISVRPDRRSTFAPHENVIVGNVALYGAVHGEAYFCGIAGERFAVRNSGAHAVVEGVGDHGCEYMTGGAVVVIGETGRNFAAGMSGGVAYVWDPDDVFVPRCNVETVSVVEPDDQQRETLRMMLEAHREETGSPRANELLARWAEAAGEFVLVLPNEYARILAARDTQKEVAHG
ncbi:MAG: glutamate synthase large subunit [Polyangiales bacterium]